MGELLHAGDPALDRALARLVEDRGNPTRAIRAARTSKHADPAGALLGVMAAYARAPGSSMDVLAGIMAMLEAGMTDLLRARILERIAGPCAPALARVLADSLLGERWDKVAQARRTDSAAVAPAADLALLAEHLRADDPLAGRAARALLVLDPASARARIAAAVRTTPALAAIGSEVAPWVNLDGVPVWVEIFGADVLAPWLRRADTPAPLRSALAGLGSGPLAAELAERLRIVGETDETAAVGTDGRFLLLLDAAAARSWRGSQHDPDYKRVRKDAAEGGVGFTHAAGVTTFALGVQRCGVVLRPAGEVWLVLAGTRAMAEALCATGSARSYAMPITFRAGAALLDAAHTVESSPKGAFAELPLAGNFSVATFRAELADGLAHVVQLRPRAF